MRFAFKTSPQDTTWAAMLEVWRAAEVLYQHCAEAGRDLAEIRLSAQVPFTGDPAAAAAAAATFGEAGAGLVIVSLPPPHTPAVLEPLAGALAELPTAALSRPGRRAT